MGKQPGFIDKILAKLFKKPKIAGSDLKRYDVVVVGGNLGGMLSKNFEHFDKGKSSVFVAGDQEKVQMYPLRSLYESKLVELKSLSYYSRQLLAKTCARSEGKRVVKVTPEENLVELEGGRKIEYGQLVLATGYTPAYAGVQGLREALEDPDVPVCAPDTFATDVEKRLLAMEIYEHGPAFFYIPPFPFSGEVESYNFLYALELWKRSEKAGIVSPVRSATIVNANSKFCSTSEKLNSHILKELEKFNVEVLYNTKLTSVDKDKRTLTFESKSGSETRPFNHLYTQQLTKKNPLLSNTKLSKDGFHVDVNPRSLQSLHFDNVFALGDCANVPIQKSMFGGLYQMNVVRANLLFQIGKENPIAEYKGNSKIFMPRDLFNAVLYKANYEKEEIDDSLAWLKLMSFMKIGKKFKKVIEGKGHGTEGRSWPVWKQQQVSVKESTKNAQ